MRTVTILFLLLFFGLGQSYVFSSDIVFAENDDIDFAYPTQRFYDNLHEGKPGARAQE